MGRGGGESSGGGVGASIGLNIYLIYFFKFINLF